MEILFTRNSMPLSRLIRYVTGEPVSHCALLWDGLVVTHMTLEGFRVTAYGSFADGQEIIYRVPVEQTMLTGDFFKKYGRARYDYGALLYLGLRAVLPFLPKANLWQTTGMFLCTEFVTQSLYGEEDSLITPYKLYERISGK